MEAPAKVGVLREALFILAHCVFGKVQLEIKGEIIIVVVVVF